MMESASHPNELLLFDRSPFVCEPMHTHLIQTANDNLNILMEQGYLPSPSDVIFKRDGNFTCAFIQLDDLWPRMTISGAWQKQGDGISEDMGMELEVWYQRYMGNLSEQCGDIDDADRSADLPHEAEGKDEERAREQSPVSQCNKVEGENTESTSQDVSILQDDAASTLVSSTVKTYGIGHVVADTADMFMVDQEQVSGISGGHFKDFCQAHTPAPGGSVDDGSSLVSWSQHSDLIFASDDDTLVAEHTDDVCFQC